MRHRPLGRRAILLRAPPLGSHRGLRLLHGRLGTRLDNTGSHIIMARKNKIQPQLAAFEPTFCARRPVTLGSRRAVPVTSAATTPEAATVTAVAAPAAAATTTGLAAPEAVAEQVLEVVVPCMAK